MHAFLQIALVTTLGLASSAAGEGTWVPVGPPGGHVRALAADPRGGQRLYLGTADGVLYRSDDGGLEWRRLNPGFPRRDCSLDEIVVDSKGNVWVGFWEMHGSGGGVARSADGGRTFTILRGLKDESVRALAVAPSDHRLVAAGSLGGVFLSRDGGASWTRITPQGHPDLRNIESLAFDPRHPQVLYAGTWHLPWKTVDGGATWQRVHQGMIDDSDVMTLAVDRRDPQTVYATACTGIYRSLDGGTEWTKLQGIPYSARRTRAFARDGELLVAGTTEGLWVSEDRGASWRQTTPKEVVVNAVLLQRDGTIVLGTEEAGVLRSSDLGMTWIDSNAGFSERFVSSKLFDPAGRRVLLAVSGSWSGGIFAAPAVRGPWTRLGKGLEGRQVLSLALLNGTVFAGTDDGIFVLPPDAAGWTRLPTVLGEADAHPRVTELLAHPPARLLAATPKGLMFSSDGGRTWAQPNLGRPDAVTALAVSPSSTSVVVAATRLGCFRSDDGGGSWRQVSSTLMGLTPHALTFMPSDDHVLFATTSSGLFRSEDRGATWQLMNGGIPHSDLTGIAVHPDGRRIYVSDFTRGGVFRSADGGATWARMATRGLASERVWSLALDPDDPDRVLASCAAGGLHLLEPARRGTSVVPLP